MRKSLKQGITEYSMPLYMQDILSNHFCPNFLKMTIVYNNNSYMFYYETGIKKKVDYSKLCTREKLTLLINLMTINFENEEWLIKGDSYLLEPELIYSIGNGVEFGNLWILFYPDFRHKSFSDKLAIFAENIKDKSNSEEVGIIEQFKLAIVSEEPYKARRILEKNIDRLEFSKVV